MTDSDYADDIALLTNTPAQAEYLLQSLEQAVGSIGLHMNTNRSEYMYFKQKGAISTLSGRLLKLVDQFTYLSSNISSTESDVNICILTVWNIIDRLSIIWKSDLTDKIGFLPSSGCVLITIWMHHIDANKTLREKVRWELHNDAT